MNMDKEGLKQVAKDTDSIGYCTLPSFMKENIEFWEKKGWIKRVAKNTHSIMITDKGRNYAHH